MASADDAADEFVQIVLLHDHIRADMIRALLETHGIPVTVPGAQFRAIEGGYLAAFISLPVMVPRRFAEEAAGLIHSLDEGVPLDGEMEDGDPEEPGPAPTDEPGPYRATAKPNVGKHADTPRLRRIAAFCSLIITFGTGHFYARDHLAGLMLLCAELVAFGAAFTGHLAGGIALPAVVLVDLFGSVAAVGRHRAGRPWAPWKQFAATGLALGLVAAAATGIAGEIERQRAEEAERLNALWRAAEREAERRAAEEERRAAEQAPFPMVDFALPGAYLDDHEPLVPPPEPTEDRAAP